MAVLAGIFHFDGRPIDDDGGALGAGLQAIAPDGVSVFAGAGVVMAHGACHVWAGEQDRLVGPEHGTWLADTIPRATLVTYPNAGHLFPITHWAEILAALCVPFR